MAHAENDNEANLIGKLPQDSLIAPVPTDPAARLSLPTIDNGIVGLRGMGSPGREMKLPTPVGPPGASLEQLLRFDATPDWITANWARVTTRVPNLDFEGWRVPLATGSTPQDIVGSITYFFDDHRYVQRITLHGYLGDASTILTMATQRFQMQRVPSRLDELFLATIEGQTLGALRVSTAPRDSRRCAGATLPDSDGIESHRHALRAQQGIPAHRSARRELRGSHRSHPLTTQPSTQLNLRSVECRPATR